MLTGQRILVTRPRADGRVLANLILAVQGEAVLFPVLETCALVRPAALEQLAGYDVVIFISQNAVKYTWACLNTTEQCLLQTKFCLAVGKRTAQALQALGVKRVFCPPPPFDSETLLGCAVLQDIRQQAILLCKGNGGRVLLQDSLRQRGALLSFACVYQRQQPLFEPQAWMQSGAIDQVVVTSAEGLANLQQMLDKPAWLYQRPWVVISWRLAALVRVAGVQTVIKVAHEASNGALLEALQRDV